MTTYLNVFKGSTAGEVWSLTLHTNKAGGTLTGANSAWVAAAALLWNGTGATDSISQYCPSTVTLTEASTAEIDPLTGKQLGRVSTAVSYTGTGTGSQLPPQNSVVGSLRTALATRKGRGRFYLPPFIVGTVSAARLSSASQTVVALCLQRMLQSLITATYVPVIWHRSSLLYDNVVSVDVGDVFDTQRRRRDKLVETRLSHTL